MAMLLIILNGCDSTVVIVENRPDGAETANVSTQFSATGGADLKHNDYRTAIGPSPDTGYGPLQTTNEEGAHAFGFAAFVVQLEAFVHLPEGLNVIDENHHDFLAENPRVLSMGDERIVVYEFSTAEEMELYASFVCQRGSAINKTDVFINISWTHWPRWYKRGLIIVRYVGDNEEIVAALGEILGDTFAGYGADGV